MSARLRFFLGGVLTGITIAVVQAHPSWWATAIAAVLVAFLAWYVDRLRKEDEREALRRR